MRANFLTTTNVTYWGTVLGSNEGVYVLLGLCRRDPYYSGRDLETRKIFLVITVLDPGEWRAPFSLAYDTAARVRPVLAIAR